MIQAISDKDKSQRNLKTVYIIVPKTLENPWNKPNNGMKSLAGNSSSFNSSSIFFAYQFHADFLF